MIHRDPNAAVEDRVAGLLALMTVEEKVAQMMQLPAWSNPRAVIERHPVGSLLHTDPATIDDAIDAAARTRLGIPLLIADDAIHGHGFWPGATVFGTPLSMACSFDPDAVERAARVTARETSATGVTWTFSPLACIARELRWGRVNETFGEDPHLIGELAAAMVRGYRGDGDADPTRILSCAKHFAGYSETQGGLDASEADLTPRKLRSWFLPPFERLVREGADTFMLGYQAIDGVPITLNRWLLHGVLKQEWGFEGLLVTDWDNVGHLVRVQKVAADFAEAAALAVHAGNDLIMSTPEFHDGALAAIERGLLAPSDLDEAVRRILAVKFRMGLFEDPRRPDVERQRLEIGCREHRGINLELAVKSLVLLRNDGVLPLRGEGVKVAVLGPQADDVAACLGDWAGTSGQCPWMDDPALTPATTLLTGLRAAAPSDWVIAHARGCGIDELAPDPEGEFFDDGQPRPKICRPAPLDETELAEAVALAANSDVAVVAVGDTINLTGEGRSTATLELFGPQRQLLEAIRATGTPMVVVLLNGKPLVLPESVQEAAAIVEAFNPGAAGGDALAAVLLGRVEPSGRLPVSFPRHAGQLPVYHNRVRGWHGDRYADLTYRPLFAFGEGLTYTSFEYSGLQVTEVGDEVAFSVDVTNTGGRHGTEVVQVYVHDVVTSVTWAEQELKAFRRVPLAPGETTRVEFRLPTSELSLVLADGTRVVEPGEFELRVGHSSRPEDQHRVRFRIG